MTGEQEKNLSIEYYNIGNGFMELEKFDDAIEYYNKSLDIDYSNNSSRYNLVLAYVKSKKFLLAVENIDILLLQDSKNHDVLSLKAYSLYEMGEYEESLKVYERLDNIRKTDNDIKTRISKLLFQLEKYEESLGYVENVIQDQNTEDDKKSLYLMAAKLLTLLENKSEAASYYSMYIEDGGEDEDILILAKDIYVELEDVKSEKEIIIKLLAKEKLKASKASLYFRLGQIYLLESDFMNGYSNLELAVNEGFNDSEKVKELLETPDLIEKDKIRELFE